MGAFVGLETEAGIKLRGATSDAYTDRFLTHMSALVIMEATGGMRDWRWPADQVLPILGGVDVEKLWEWGIQKGWWDPVTAARGYVDHMHPEWSTPEERTPWLAVLRAMQGQRKLEAAAVSIALDAERNPGGRRLMLFGNSTSGDPEISFGPHISVSFSEAVSRSEFTRPLASFFTPLQVITGTGTILWDTQEHRHRYWISQRGPYMVRVVGPETTLNRPIINTRDTSLDLDRTRKRMHVICLDTNMNEVACLLKTGLTMIVMSMIEAQAWPRQLTLKHILKDWRGVAGDPSLTYRCQLTSDRVIRVVPLLREWQDAIEMFFEARYMYRWQKLVLALFDEVLTLLEGNKFDAKVIIEWLYKYETLLATKRRLGLADYQWRHPKLDLIDLQWHSYIHTPRVDGDKVGLYHQARANGRVRTLYTDAHLADTTVPGGRAAIRQLLLGRYGGLAYEGWYSLTFLANDDPGCWNRGVPWLRFRFMKSNGVVPAWLSEAVATSPDLSDLWRILRAQFGDAGGVRDHVEVRFRPDGADTGTSQYEDAAYD